MSSAMCDIKSSVFHVIDETVFIIDATAVFALEIAGQGFGFPDPLPAAIAFNILFELVDAF